MKKEIHPDYKPVVITCVCGNSIETGSVKQGIKVEICNACHPFYAGTQKIVDTEGRVDRFKKRYSQVDTAAMSAKKLKADKKAKEEAEKRAAEEAKEKAKREADKKAKQDAKAKEKARAKQAEEMKKKLEEQHKSKLDNPKGEETPASEETITTETTSETETTKEEATKEEATEANS
jgi:large subunit ribosomal protein L31